MTTSWLIPNRSVTAPAPLSTSQVSNSRKDEVLYSLLKATNANNKLKFSKVSAAMISSSAAEIFHQSIGKPRDMVNMEIIDSFVMILSGASIFSEPVPDEQHVQVCNPNVNTSPIQSPIGQLLPSPPCLLFYLGLETLVTPPRDRVFLLP